MHPRDERLIERYFEGDELSSSEREQLFARVAADEECRTYFDDLAEAERMLAGGQEVPSTQLDLIKQSVLADVAPSPVSTTVPMAGWLWKVAGLAGAVAAVGLVVVLGNRPIEPTGELVARGGSSPHTLAVEALCFDAKAEVVKSAHESTSCPAPGFVKLLFASPHPAEQISVLVRARTAETSEVRINADVQRAQPRSILPGHAKLEPGEQLEVFVAPDTIDVGSLEQMKPAMIISGVEP